MIWAPFAIAILLALVISAGLYFAYMWPDIDELDGDGDAPVTAAAPPPEVAPVAPVVPPADVAPPEPAAESPPA